MLNTPSFIYCLYSDHHQVSETSAEWHTPLRLERCQQAVPSSNTINISFGDYFFAARNFIESLDAEVLSLMASGSDAPITAFSTIESVRIMLEKHGAFYHPARVLLKSNGKAYPFVLNLAVSKAGLDCIKSEFQRLRNLNQRYDLCFLPKVYAEGNIIISGRRQLGMFIGEWFEGFHEFHLTLQPYNKHAIAVWDPDKGLIVLSEQEMILLYQQAAAILTYYYDVFSFERIDHWHHAAGDFVVKQSGSEFSTRIITVRDYAPLFGADEINAETVIAALLYFLLDMTIKMRVDRLDGVGQTVCAGDMAIIGVFKGFFQGLQLKRQTGQYPDDSLENGLKNLAESCSRSDWQAMASHIIASYPDGTPEKSLMLQFIDRHLDVFHQTMRKLIIKGESDFFC